MPASGWRSMTSASRCSSTPTSPSSMRRTRRARRCRNPHRALRRCGDGYRRAASNSSASAPPSPMVAAIVSKSTRVTASRITTSSRSPRCRASLSSTSARDCRAGPVRGLEGGGGGNEAADGGGGRLIGVGGFPIGGPLGQHGTTRTVYFILRAFAQAGVHGGRADW